MKNLKAEMARNGVSNKDIQEILKCSPRTVVNKINGESDFTIRESILIRDTFFAGIKLEYLFAV